MVKTRFLLLTLLFALSVAAFMTLGARGNWDFILPFRGMKLLALVTIATAVALSTMVFQTLTANRILTPSIMGFDALYLMLQTGLVFFLGGFGFATLDPTLKFTLETALMLTAALILFGTVLRNAADLSRMVLTGLILGVFFRSLTALINRLIDPSEFSVVQQASFARFNAVNADLTWIATGITLAVFLWLMRQHRALDVISLGREAAINLGVDHDRATKRLLVAIALLVSVSTALVGPIVFFGLLVSALTHRIIGTWRHAALLPASALIAATVLIASQTLFERALRLQTSVSVVIEALGGLVFLFLILHRRPR